jgi:hypothetical protein
MLTAVRSCLRRWAKAKVLFGGVVGTLAVSVALSATAFGLIRLIGAPVSGVAEPNRVVEMRPLVSHQAPVDWTQVRRELADIRVPAAIWQSPMSTLLRARGDLLRVGASRVGTGFLGILGVTSTVVARPTPAVASAYLSHALWIRVGAPQAFAFEMDAAHYEMVGVLPADFSGIRFATRVDVWLVVEDESLLGSQATSLVARLTGDQDLRSIRAALPPTPQLTVVPLESAEPGSSYRLRQLALLASSNAVGLCIISLLGVGLLLLARLSNRATELGVRLSVGASTSQLLATLLVDTAVAVVPGVALGALLAVWSRDFVPAAFAPEALELVQLRIDTTAVAMSSGIAVLWCLAISSSFVLFGPRLLVSLAGRRTVPPVRFGFHRQAVLAQVFLAMLLITSSPGLLRLLDRCLMSDAGEALVDVAVAAVDIPTPTKARTNLAASVVDAAARLQAIGSARISAVTSDLPSSSPVAETFGIRGYAQDIRVQYVSPEYFDVMSLPVMPEYGARDIDASSVVVNDALADRFLPGGRALGANLVSSAGVRLRIVGVALERRLRTLEPPIAPKVYREIGNRFTFSGGVSANVQRVFFLVRGERPLRTGLLDAELTARVPGTVVRGFKPLSAQLRQSLLTERLVRFLAMLVALVSVGIAVMGAGSMIAADLQTKRLDLAVHVALGATPTHLAKVVGWRLGGLVALSGIAGLAASAIAGGLIDRQLAEHLAAPSRTDLAWAAALLAISWVATTATQVRLARRLNLSLRS